MAEELLLGFFHRLDPCLQRFRNHHYNRLHRSLRCWDRFLCFLHQRVCRCWFQLHQLDHLHPYRHSLGWFRCWSHSRMFQYWFQQHHLNHHHQYPPWWDRSWFPRTHQGQSIHHHRSLRCLLLVQGLLHYHLGLLNYQPTSPHKSQEARLHPGHHPFCLSGLLLRLVL